MTDSFVFNWNTLANLVMAGACVGMFILARRRQSSDVRLVADPVSREHCEEVHQSEAVRLQAFQAQLDEYNSSRRTDVGMLHEKINNTARDVSAVKASVDMLGRRFDQVEAGMTNLPDRVIATLKNTGAI